MIEDILEKLSENPNAIIELLTEYGYEKFKQNDREIRFARNASGGMNITIYIGDNHSCLVKDFVLNESNNIINFIINQKNVEFKDVLQSVKRILRLDDYWEPKKNTALFGGIYQGISNRKEHIIKSYPDSILNQYSHKGNILWLRDGISLKVQKEFNVCFNIIDNSILFPWRNQFGGIIAIKNRVNGVPEEGMSKYYYSLGGCISSALYGYSENWKYLQNTEILIGESEKQVLQLATKGYRNSVSLGSNNLSQQQAALILSLNPTKVIWLMDESLPKENTFKNAKILNDYCKIRSVPQYWWNWERSTNVPSGSKMSPGDCSAEIFNNILQNELEEIDLSEQQILHS